MAMGYVVMRMTYMKLQVLKCPECRKKISDKATACIHCGCPISSMLEQEDTKLWHLSPLTLFNMYDEEKKTGNITFPEEV